MKLKKSLYHPRQWPFWILIGLLWLVAKLPYRWLLALGKKLGKVLFKIGGKGKKTAIINLKLCFPALSAQEREKLLIKHFEAAGISLMETALAWWGNAHKLKPLLHIQGLEYWQQALAAGKGVIFCSAHFMTLELAGRLLAMEQPFSVVYRSQKNAVLDKFAKRHRNRIYQRIIARGDLRGMLKYLKQNGTVWFTPDIDAGLKNSVFVPFFGVPAATITATARLANMSGAQVLTAFCYRRSDESGYDVCISPPLANYPSTEPQQDAWYINQLIENAVLQAPEQYLWQYKRFKTRPGDESRFYD